VYSLTETPRLTQSRAALRLEIRGQYSDWNISRVDIVSC